MVLSIARQSVIIKCSQQKSVLLGNYEFYYLAGLMEKIFRLGLNADMTPDELFSVISERLDSLQPADAHEKYLIDMVRFFETLPEHDAQMKQLFEWGKNEPDMWQVQTSYIPPAENSLPGNRKGGGEQTWNSTKEEFF